MMGTLHRITPSTAWMTEEDHAQWEAQLQRRAWLYEAQGCAISAARSKIGYESYITARAEISIEAEEYDIYGNIKSLYAYKLRHGLPIGIEDIMTRALATTRSASALRG